MPGGITVTHRLDEAGEETGLTYSGQITETDGTVTTGDWIAWSQTNDATGRVRTDATTFASAIATTAGIDAGTDAAAPVTTDPQIAFDHRYTYDKAGALTKVEDLTGLPVNGAAVSPYTTREYTFTTNGARETLTEQIHADGTTAGPATPGAQQKLSYDSADRPTGGYVYDEFGRQKTLPAAHAPNPSAGDVQLGYFDTDLPASITQGATSTSFTLDVTARRLAQTTNTDGKTSTVTRHYTDGSDNPAWIETVAPDGTKASTRYTGSISGALGASIADDGAVSMMLPNIHGDIVTTIPITATAKAADPATTITGWAAYTEYGTPIDPAQTKTVSTAAGYGWLGAKERSTTDGSAGLTLMGDRLYNAITGAFTSTDPEPGGNLTAYTYPIDPINMYDLNGHKGWLKRAGRWWGKHGDKVLRGAGLAAFGVCVLASGGACAAVGGLVAAASIANNAVKYKNKQISGKRFITSSAFDVLGVFTPGLRGFKGARAASKGPVRDFVRQFRLAKPRFRAGRRAASPSSRARLRHYAGGWGRAASRTSRGRYAARVAGQGFQAGRAAFGTW